MISTLLCSVAQGREQGAGLYPNPLPSFPYPALTVRILKILALWGARPEDKYYDVPYVFI